MASVYERNLSKDYLMAEIIGKGSFGEVNKAIHRTTRQCVALKKIANAGHSLVSHLREVKMMKKCKEGPNILQIYGSEIVGNDLWISMELCESGSLFDIMRLTQSNFTEFQIAKICKSTLRAIAWMAEKNMAHRDIKPHNLMVKQSGKIRVGDFGISKEMDCHGQATDMIGSLLYLAPEVARKQPYTTKVDIWSLGVTCIELAQGYAPRHRLSQDELLRELAYGEQPPSFSAPGHYSSCFLDFVGACLIIEPSHRPSAAELLNHPFLKLAKGLKLGHVSEEVSCLVSLNGSYASALEGSLLARSRGSSSSLYSASSISSHDDGSKSGKSDAHALDADSPGVSANNSPVTPRIRLTPKTTRNVPHFVRPMLLSTKRPSDVFILGVSQALASPRDFQQQIENLE